MKQVVEILPSSRSSISVSLKQNTHRVTQLWVHNMMREELALVKQNGGWKPPRKKRIIWPFLPSKWVKFSVLLIKLIFLVGPSPLPFYFYVFYSIQIDPSWSDLDRRSELIRSDFCTCLKKIFVLNNVIFWTFYKTFKFAAILANLLF